MYYKAEIEVRVHEDHYQRGEEDFVQEYDLPEIKEKTLEKLFDTMQDYMGDMEGWIAGRWNEYEWATEIETNMLQNAEGMEPTPSERRKWERGEIILFSASYKAFVSKVGEFPVRLNTIRKEFPEIEVED